MFLASTILLVAIVIATLVSLHAGPHGLVASGTIGIMATIVLLCDAIFLVKVSAPPVLLGLLIAIICASLAIIALGIRGIKTSKLSNPKRMDTKLLTAPGIALTDLTPNGTVKILGEIWSAESLSGTVKAGVEVYVSEIDGLRLKVWANPELSKTMGQENKI